MKVVFKNYWRTRGINILADVELLTLYTYPSECRVLYIKLFNFGITIFFRKNGK